MAGLSNGMEDAVLETLFRNTAWTALNASRLMSVHTADSETGANEATGGSYARQSCSFNASSGGSVALSAAVEFTGMPAGTFTHVGIWDGAGTPVFIGMLALSSSAVLSAGQTLRVTAGTFSLD